MAMLTGYFDAAGDNRGTHAVTVGGYVSPVRSWSRFRRDWCEVLGRVGIDVFHMTDFMAGQGQFTGWKDKPVQQTALLNELAKVVVRHAHFSPSTTVLLDDWRAVNQEYTLKECHATPYALAAFKVISKSIDWIGREHPHDSLQEFVFEDGDTGRGDLQHFMNWVREASRNRLAPHVYPVFKPKSLAPLQSADFVVWEHRFVAAKRLQGDLTELRAPLAALMRVKRDWGVIDRPRIVEWCDWLTVPKRSASARLSQKDHARWRPSRLRQRGNA